MISESPARFLHKSRGRVSCVDCVFTQSRRLESKSLEVVTSAVAQHANAAFRNPA